jgi:ankyrin repeat protein
MTQSLLLTCYVHNCANRTSDVEEGTTSAASLLESVTMEGDNALHLLAANGANGDGENVEDDCAKFIHNQGKSLLYKKNNKGDTPLHCAVRAGKSLLASCLTGLAKEDGKVQDLLRNLNNNNETALHEAVRRGDKIVVKELMRTDPELASFPTNGVSPLYLAIQLIDDTTILQKEDKADRSEGDEKSMAQTLHDESKGLLSYSGPNGQNALHAAVLRGPGTHKEACMRSFLASIHMLSRVYKTGWATGFIQNQPIFLFKIKIPIFYK